MNSQRPELSGCDNYLSEPDSYCLNATKRLTVGKFLRGNLTNSMKDVAEMGFVRKIQSHRDFFVGKALAKQFFRQAALQFSHKIVRRGFQMEGKVAFQCARRDEDRPRHPGQNKIALHGNLFPIRAGCWQSSSAHNPPFVCSDTRRPLSPTMRPLLYIRTRNLDSFKNLQKSLTTRSSPPPKLEIHPKIPKTHNEDGNEIGGINVEVQHSHLRVQQQNTEPNSRQAN